MEKSQRSSVNAETGSTLIEVLVATTILLTGVMMMAQLLTISAISNTASRTDTFAAVLAEQKLEQLRALAYGFDVAGLPMSDVDTDTSVSPEAPGGTGLQPSPGNSLQANTQGFVDYVDGHGQIVGNGVQAPASAVFTRRWSVEPLPTNPNNTIIIQVLVTPIRNRGQADQQGNVGRLPGEARVMTVKTRKAQ